MKSLDRMKLITLAAKALFADAGKGVVINEPRRTDQNPA